METVVGTRVFVSNLPWSVTWQDLKDTFRSCGNVVYSNIKMDKRGLSRGWGIVEFESPEQAAVAVQTMNGVELEGRAMLVREDKMDREVVEYKQQNGTAPEEGTGGRGQGRGGRGRGGRGRGPREPRPAGESSGLQIVVQGIPWAYKWTDLKDMFSGVAEIERADVTMDRSGRSKGFGVVRFFTTEAAQSAIDQFNGTELEGRTLTVKFDAYA